MKHLEVIRKIIEESPNENVTDLIFNDIIYNLTLLCILNKKYLTEENLNLIVKAKPKLLQFNKHNIMPKGYYSYIAILISNYPEIFNKLSNDNIKKFNCTDWVEIIQKQPKLIDQCNIINKFTKNDWITILKKQPQLTCEYKDFYNNFSWSDIYYLIKNNKKILDYININEIKILNENISDIISLYPKMIESIDKNKISISQWVEILKDQPKLIELCPVVDKIKEYPYQNIVELVSKQPKFVDMLPSVDKLEKKDLVKLVKNRPQLIEELNIDIKKFEAYDWANILIDQPKLIDKCNKINELNALSPDVWATMLIRNVELEKYCNKFDEFGYDFWYKLLTNKPQFIDKCKIPLTKSTRTLLLEINPELIEKIKIDDISEDIFKNIVYKSKKNHIKVIEKYVEMFNNKDSTILTNMVGIYPDLKNLYTEKNLWQYVDFKQLSDNLEYSILK